MISAVTVQLASRLFMGRESARGTSGRILLWIQLKGDTAQNCPNQKVRLYHGKTFSTRNKESLSSAYVQGSIWGLSLSTNIPPFLTGWKGRPWMNMCLRGRWALSPVSPAISPLGLYLCEPTALVWETVRCEERVLFLSVVLPSSFRDDPIDTKSQPRGGDHFWNHMVHFPECTQPALLVDRGINWMWLRS